MQLLRETDLVSFSKGVNHAKGQYITDKRLLSEPNKNAKRTYKKTERNSREIFGQPRAEVHGQEIYRKRRSISERTDTKISRVQLLGSRGLNDRGVIETLNHIDDGETAERVIKQFRENTLKRTGLLEAEQAAKAIKLQDGDV